MHFKRFLGLMICLTHPAKFRALKSHPSDQFFNRYSKKVQIMQSDTIVTAPPGEWRHPDDYPPPRGKIILILSRYGVATKGKWDDSDAAWMPLPKIEPSLKKRLQDEGRLK